MREYVANKVYLFRKDMGVIQEDFANAIGVSRQTVVAIEKGNYTPSLLLGLKIAKYFKKAVEEVFVYTYEK